MQKRVILYCNSSFLFYLLVLKEEILASIKFLKSFKIPKNVSETKLFLAFVHQAWQNDPSCCSDFQHTFEVHHFIKILLEIITQCKFQPFNHTFFHLYSIAKILCPPYRTFFNLPVSNFSKSIQGFSNYMFIISAQFYLKFYLTWPHIFNCFIHFEFFW